MRTRWIPVTEQVQRAEGQEKGSQADAAAAADHLLLRKHPETSAATADTPPAWDCGDGANGSVSFASPQQRIINYHSYRGASTEKQGVPLDDLVCWMLIGSSQH